jgi:hypothetical protein
MWPLKDPGGGTCSVQGYEEGEPKNLAKEYGRGENCANCFAHEIITNGLNVATNLPNCMALALISDTFFNCIDHFFFTYISIN